MSFLVLFLSFVVLIEENSFGWYGDLENALCQQSFVECVSFSELSSVQKRLVTIRQNSSRMYLTADDLIFTRTSERFRIMRLCRDTPCAAECDLMSRFEDQLSEANNLEKMQLYGKAIKTTYGRSLREGAIYCFRRTDFRSL